MYRKLKQDPFCSARVNCRLCAERMKKQNSQEQKDPAGEESFLTWVGVICIKKKNWGKAFQKVITLIQT